MESGGQITGCVTWDNYTPLHEAVENGHSRMVEYLVSMGADTTIRTVGPIELFLSTLNKPLLEPRVDCDSYLSKTHTS